LKLSENPDLLSVYRGADSFPDGSEPLFLALPEDFFALGDVTEPVLSLAGGSNGFLTLGLNAIDSEGLDFALEGNVFLFVSKEEAIRYVEEEFLPKAKGLSRDELEARFGFRFEEL
jgi:hypothetical protein